MPESIVMRPGDRMNVKRGRFRAALTRYVRLTRRRLLVALGSVLAAPLVAFAQQKPARIYRIGVLDGTAAAENRMGALMKGLRDPGYVSGKNIVIEHRHAGGRGAGLWFPTAAAR